jgi:hypothetical protein
VRAYVQGVGRNQLQDWSGSEGVASLM